MNCPRCTHELPEDAGFCSRCGLDLANVSVEVEIEAEAEAEAVDESILDDPPPAPDPVHEEESGGLWPHTLRIHKTRGPKRPYLAATLAFFFGPFAYLYLEQANWFWWGLLGGFGFIFLSRGEAIPILVIGYMIHAYDIAILLCEEQAGIAPGAPEPGIEG